MKNLSSTVIAFFFLTLLMQSCADTCETTHTMIYYEPVYTSLEDLRSSVGIENPRDVNQSGKIFYINKHLLINEPNEGIHIIDNSDPKNPKNIGFLTIPGNFDMAAVDGYLYADSYIDVVVFDISNITAPKEVKRLKNIFPNYNSYGYYVDKEKGIVTDWVQVEKVQEYNDNCENFNSNGNNWINFRGGIALAESASFSSMAAVSPANPGVGGSMSRFTVANQHLYMIDRSNMHVADITDPENPMLGAQTNVGWGIETIFPYDTLIFIGANNGMSIYDVSIPMEPQRLSTYSHVRSCDPVVTDGRYAYVTLRSGSECAGFTNQLDVLDIADPSDPQLVKTYPMYNPHGLSVNNNRLFLCDGKAGLKVYNVSDVNKIDQNLIKHYGDIHAYDVIVADCLIMLIGDDGLHQYDCSDFQDDIAYLSHIPFNNK